MTTRIAIVDDDSRGRAELIARLREVAQVEVIETNHREQMTLRANRIGGRAAIQRAITMAALAGAGAVAVPDEPAFYTQPKREAQWKRETRGRRR